MRKRLTRFWYRLGSYLIMLFDRSEDMNFVSEKVGGRWTLSGDISDIMTGRGCLYGKTNQQIADFFNSLRAFYDHDPEFFHEQVDDLLPYERAMFTEFLKSESSVYVRNDYISDHFSIWELLKDIEETSGTKTNGD